MNGKAEPGQILGDRSRHRFLFRKRFTRQEVDRLAGLGAFEGQRYELIDGDLIDKMGQNPPHAFSFSLLLSTLLRFLDSTLIRIQLPIEAEEGDRERSLPEPDLAVLAENKSEYLKRHPRGDELLLVIEVSDTTIAFDLSRKAALYARAGVPEYWVLDLGRRRLVVHRRPQDSEYRLIQLFAERDVVSIEGRTETVAVAEILPPAQP
jgi:Uma2 family endonuclease